MITINTVLIGNILSFIAAVLFVLMGLAKTRKKMLTLQLAQVVFLGFSNIVLHAFTGAVMNFVALVRNILCLKFRYTLLMKIVISAVLVGLGLYANNRGLLGVLPIIGTVLVTCCLDFTNVPRLKLAYIISCLLWAFYDFAVSNYSSCLMDIFGITSNIIGIITVRRAEGTAQ